MKRWIFTLVVIVDFLFFMKLSAATINFGGDTTLYEDQSGAYTTVAFTSILLDATGEKVGFIARFPAGTYRKFEFATGTITTGDTIQFTLETVSTFTSSGNVSTGTATGNLLCTNSSGTININSIDDNVWVQSGSMVADCTISSGVYAAIVLTQAGTFNGNFRNPNGGGFSAGQLSFVISSNSASGWVKSVESADFAALDSTGNYIKIQSVFPYSGTAAAAFNSSSPATYRGNRIIIPFNLRATGFKMSLITADATVNLFDANGVGLATTTISSVSASAIAGRVGAGFDTGPVSLTAGSTVYLTVHPTTSSNISYQENTCNTDLIQSVHFPGEVVLATASAPTNFSLTTNRRELFYLTYDQATTTSGSVTTAYPYVQ